MLPVPLNPPSISHHSTTAVELSYSTNWDGLSEALPQRMQLFTVGVEYVTLYIAPPVPGAALKPKLHCVKTGAHREALTTPPPPLLPKLPANTHSVTRGEDSSRLYIA